jgi:hypothetical protein
LWEKLLLTLLKKRIENNKDEKIEEVYGKYLTVSFTGAQVNYENR